MKFRPSLIHFQEKTCPSCHRQKVIYFDWDVARFKCYKCQATILNPYTGTFEAVDNEDEDEIPKEVELNQNWLDFMKYMDQKYMESKEAK